MKIIALVLTALVVATAAKHLAKPITGRSSRWDQMIYDHETRHKRQAQGWQTRSRPCTLSDVTQFDQLGRRNSGLLAPVANQGNVCGNCWAFAATHAVTDTRSIQAGRRLELLSTQYTTRCGSRHDSFGYGCCGDDSETALRYFLGTGITTDACLPYNDMSSLPPREYEEESLHAYKENNALECFSTCDNGARLNPIRLYGYRKHTNPTDNTIINALTSGQIVITSIRGNEEFKNYGCGVFTSSPPFNQKSNHAVIIVDYGTTDTGDNFWVIKNSWGISTWGEGGYMRVKRGQGDLGIGHYRILIPLLSQDDSLPPSDPTTESDNTCAPEDVSDPFNNNFTMSAVEFALQGLVDSRQVQCPNGEAATGLTLLSFDDADVQVVAGTMVQLIVQTRLEGCGTTVTKCLYLTVLIDLDGMFTLIDYDNGNTAKILTASMLLLFAMVMISLVINN